MLIMALSFIIFSPVDSLATDNENNKQEVQIEQTIQCVNVVAINVQSDCSLILDLESDMVTYELVETNYSVNKYQCIKEEFKRLSFKAPFYTIILLATIRYKTIQ